MSLLRIIKSKGWLSLIILLTITIYLVLTWNKNIPTKRVKEQSQFQQQASFIAPELKRVDASHQQLLNSALAHIRLGYVANRTPYYSTPPLLVLYSCKTEHACGPLSNRLIDITNHYYFSMLQQGSAFAYDMHFPVRFEWYFEPLPGYMSMNVDQASDYLERASAEQIKQEDVLTKKELVLTRFMEEYQQQGVTIVNTTVWKGDWMDLKKNPSMQALRDKYRLNHLPQKSDWFWIVSQLLFSQPTSDLKTFLAPYQEIMGGKIERSTSLAPLDPESQATTAEFRAKGWFRIGLRLSAKQTLTCVMEHILQVCQQQLATDPHLKSCHVFLSTSNRALFNEARKGLSGVGVSVHAVAERYGFADLNEIPEHRVDQTGLFDSEEGRLKKDYARVFMDWLILTRMDYLIGQENDGYLKTAAWAAQVQTDIITKQCQIHPMTDW